MHLLEPLDTPSTDPDDQPPVEEYPPLPMLTTVRELVSFNLCEERYSFLMIQLTRLAMLHLEQCPVPPMDTWMPLRTEDWIRRLNSIHEKVARFDLISEEEDTQLTTYLGYIYAGLANSYIHTQQSNYTITDGCGLSELSTANLVTSLLDGNGPKPPGSPFLNQFWKLNATAIVVGFRAMRYLPGLSADRFVNLGVVTQTAYNVDQGRQEIDTNVGFKTHLNLIISEAGKSLSCPILVEFFFSSIFSPHNVHRHIGGFMKLIVMCQQNYSGTVAVIIPPFLPTSKHLKPLAYEAGKRKHEKLCNTLQIYGHMLGVPVYPLYIQHRLDTSGRYYWRRNSFEPYALFDAAGLPTCEYYRRLERELVSIVSNIMNYTLRASMRAISRNLTPEPLENW